MVCLARNLNLNIWRKKKENIEKILRKRKIETVMKKSWRSIETSKGIKEERKRIYVSIISDFLGT